MRTFERLADSSVPDGFESLHLIPVGVFSSKAFAPAFEAMRADGFDVRFFRRDGLFLPATEVAAIRSGLPLHRGPHRRCNELVAYGWRQFSAILAASGTARRHAVTPSNVYTISLVLYALSCTGLIRICRSTSVIRFRAA